MNRKVLVTLMSLILPMGAHAAKPISEVLSSIDASSVESKNLFLEADQHLIRYKDFSKNLESQFRQLRIDEYALKSFQVVIAVGLSYKEATELNTASSNNFDSLKASFEKIGSLGKDFYESVLAALPKAQREQFAYAFANPTFRAPENEHTFISNTRVILDRVSGHFDHLDGIEISDLYSQIQQLETLLRETRKRISRLRIERKSCIEYLDPSIEQSNANYSHLWDVSIEDILANMPEEGAADSSDED